MNGVDFNNYEQFISQLDQVASTENCYLQRNSLLCKGSLTVVARGKDKAFRTQEILHIVRMAVATSHQALSPKRRAEFLEKAQQALKNYSNRLTKSFTSAWWRRVVYFFGYRPQLIRTIHSLLDKIGSKIEMARARHCHIWAEFQDEIQAHETRLQQAANRIRQIQTVSSLYDLDQEECFVGSIVPCLKTASYIPRAQAEDFLDISLTFSDLFRDATEKLSSLQHTQIEQILSGEQKRALKIGEEIQQEIKEVSATFGQNFSMLSRGAIQGSVSSLLERHYNRIQTKTAQLFKRAVPGDRLFLLSQKFLKKHPQAQEVKELFLSLHAEVKNFETLMTQKYSLYTRMLGRKNASSFRPQCKSTPRKKAIHHRMESPPPSPVCFPPLNV